MLKRSQNFCPVSLVFQKAAIVKQMVIVQVKMEGTFDYYLNLCQIWMILLLQISMVRSYFILLCLYRCVACKCQECAQSPKGSEIFNPPLTFVIDTTKSVKPDKDSIFNLTQKGTFSINKFVSKNIKNIILKRSDVQIHSNIFSLSC